MKKVILLGLVFLLSFACTIYSRIMSDAEEPEYIKVEATVVSSETKITRIAGSQLEQYIVEVRYDGNTYRLGNPHDSRSYVPGRKVTAYLANGKLYANKEGVQNATFYGKLYLGSLVLTIILFFVWVCCIPVFLKRK